ncbi:MAG: DsrE family protein [Candidatus Rokubacteria bacterium]|nr:DsrE family protein [Candidatus Rokubacteria bacterium]
MDESLPVLVLISEDPRTSHRANEAMRIALGVAAGENEVTIILTGPAAHLLDADTDDLVDGDDIARHRGALRKMEVPFHIEKSAIPTDTADWNEEGHPLIPVSRDEIADLMGRCRRFIVF